MADKNLSWKQKIIDPKNPKTVGTSYLKLGNHILLGGFIAAIVFVVYVSY